MWRLSRCPLGLLSYFSESLQGPDLGLRTWPRAGVRLVLRQKLVGKELVLFSKMVFTAPGSSRVFFFFFCADDNLGQLMAEFFFFLDALCCSIISLQATCVWYF